MTRTAYLVAIHAGCLAMALPAGVIVVAMRLWLERTLVWCSDRVSRRFVRRVISPAEPAGSSLAKDAKVKRALKVRSVVRPAARLPVGGEERGMRAISPFVG